ncbi:Fasciclin-1 [Schistosoma japonicum]|nr:Fasciclin-1 [Schistosoma japonicum]
MITTDKNLWQVIISYSNVSKFADFIREIGLQTLLEKPGCLGDDECLTIIAPTNDAIDLIANDLAWYSLGDFQKHSFIHSHIIQRGITTDQSSIRVTTRDWTKLNRQMNFIDIGFGTDIMASNGMIHIVNQVLYTSHISLPFMDFLDKQGNLGISKELWYLLLQEPKYTPYPAQNIYSTVFVVSNSGWNSVPTVHMNRLRKNITLLASILAYHYCPNQLIYREWISVKPYLNIYTGFPNRPQLAITISSGNTEAKLYDKSFIIEKAIVHIIEKPLGFVYETREEILNRINSNLLSLCQLDAVCKNTLTSSSDVTIFSPNEQAMQNFNKLSATQKAAYLKYLVLPMKLYLAEMTTSRPTFIEVRLPNQGYVAARIINANQVATNGIVHIIDAIPDLDIRKTYYVPTANYAFTRERLRLDITSKNSDQEGSFTYQGEKCQISSVNGPYQFTNGFLYSIDKILYTKSDLNATLCSVSACG